MITTVLVLMFSVYTSSCDLVRLAGSYTLLYIILFYYLNPKCNKLPFSDTGTCCSIFSFPSFYTSIHTPLVLPSPSELYIFKIVISSIFIWNGFCTYFNPAHFTCCQSRQQSQVKESWSCKFFFTFDRYPLARFSSFVNPNFKLLLSFRGKIFFDERKLYTSVKFSLLMRSRMKIIVIGLCFYQK